MTKFRKRAATVDALQLFDDCSNAEAILTWILNLGGTAHRYSESEDDIVQGITVHTPQGPVTAPGGWWIVRSLQYSVWVFSVCSPTVFTALYEEVES